MHLTGTAQSAVSEVNPAYAGVLAMGGTVGVGRLQAAAPPGWSAIWLATASATNGYSSSIIIANEAVRFHPGTVPGIECSELPAAISCRRPAMQ